MPNIKLKNKNGIDVIYEGILSVTFDTDDGKKATCVYVPEGDDDPTTPDTPTTNTTASIVDGTLVLNNAQIDSNNNLELDGASIDEQGYLVLEKESE